MNAARPGHRPETGRRAGPADRRRRHLVLFSPSFPPAAGGAANYAATLASLLARHRIFERISVFTEWESLRHGATYRPQGVEVKGILAKRTRRNRKDLLSYLAYAWQMVLLPGLVAIYWRSDRSYWFHSSWFYNKNSVLPVLKGLCRLTPTRPKLILDVRDPLIDSRCTHAFQLFDQIIACSANVKQHLLALGAPADKIAEIPIPVAVDPSAVAATTPPNAVAELNPYVMAAHGFTRGKNTELVLEAVKTLRAWGHELRAVVIGRARYFPAIAQEGLRDGWLVFTGPLSNAVALAICQRADLHVNVCPTDGMPRSSLEALALGTKAVLPPNVPEFDRHCPDWVFRGQAASDLAATLTRTLADDRPVPYPLERHRPDRLVAAYTETLT